METIEITRLRAKVDGYVFSLDMVSYLGILSTEQGIIIFRAIEIKIELV